MSAKGTTNKYLYNLIKYLILLWNYPFIFETLNTASLPITDKDIGINIGHLQGRMQDFSEWASIPKDGAYYLVVLLLVGVVPQVNKFEQVSIDVTCKRGGVQCLM